MSQERASSAILSVGSLKRRFFTHWKTCSIKGVLIQMTDSVSDLEHRTQESCNHTADNYLLIKSLNAHSVRRFRKLEKRNKLLEDSIESLNTNISDLKNIVIPSMILLGMKWFFF